MKRSGRPPDTNASNQTSASHCRRDGRVLKIFDWPATRSVYVAIRGEVKRKMAEPRPPAPLHVRVFRHRRGARVRFNSKAREKFYAPEIVRPAGASRDSTESTSPVRPP